MKQEDYEKMKEELKKEFSNILQSNHFNGIINILQKYHPSGEEAITTAQVLIVSEFIESDENRNELDPLCTFSISFDKTGKYSRVGFGVIPEGKISVNR